MLLRPRLSKASYLIALIICANAIRLPATPKSATANGLFAGAHAVDTLIDTAVRGSLIPGAVLLVGHNGQVIYRKSYGHRALIPHLEDMTPDTIFDCASLTKVVATTPTVMKLFEAGKIRLNDKVTEYIPEFQHGHSDITIRDLLTHYSGLRPDFDLDPPFSGYAAGMDRALNDVPTAPPGAKFVYSDTNFILLGEIVQRLSGQPLEEFARQQIFLPLGMSDTTFRPSVALVNRIAPTIQLENGDILRGTVHDPRSRLMGGVAGHAGLFSTADDLAIYCQMLLNKGVNPAADATHPSRIFSPITVDLFTSPQSPAGATAVRGFGWDIDSPFSANRGELFPAGTSFGHTGYTGTSIWIDPASQTYVILLTNSVHPKEGKKIVGLRKSIATAVAAAVGYPRHTVGPTRTGLDVLEGEHFQMLQGKRVGLITNQTGIDCERRRDVDVMRAAGVNITALMSPEHGIAGQEDRPNVANALDRASGLTVFSLFAGKTQRPTPVMLRNVDVVVFDIADVGARFYTYMTTMAYSMEECAKEGKPFIVLDRPNPVTGLRVGGPVLDPKNESFIGYFPMPVCHGMTIGELARMFNTENQIHADLTVVPMLGWHRGDWFDETGQPWVDPSPNIRDLTATLLYPGLAMLEGSENYSVGRGTADPFHAIGAKWMNGARVAGYLNERNIPGVRAYPIQMHPESNHYAGSTIDGVRFTITDRSVFDPMRLGLEIAAALRKLYPGQIHFDANRKLIGSDADITSLEKGDDAVAIRALEQPAIDAFLAVRQKYLLYSE